MQKIDKSALTRNHLVSQENETNSHVNNIKRQTKYIIFVVQKIRSQTINERKISEERLEENQSKLWLCKYGFNYGSSYGEKLQICMVFK